MAVRPRTSTSAPPGTRRVGARADPCDRRFEALVFDWDGTAVADRAADAAPVRGAVEELCALGVDILVITGTHVGNVDGQLAARPAGPGQLLLLLNRGSEVFRVGESGPEIIHRRTATQAEDDALDRAARLAVERLGERGLTTQIVSRRLNRRKIDLIPEPEWADPPKASIAALLDAVEERLHRHGISSLVEVLHIAVDAAEEAGVEAPRVTSDAKHAEIGLTDKADSARWAFRELHRRGIAPSQVLVLGDEFGPLGGTPGSDSLLLVDEARDAVALSVGVEPLGVPDGVEHIGGGPDRFLRILRDQIARRRRGELPTTAIRPGWSLVVEGVDPERERADEARLTLGDGVLGTSGSPVLAHADATPRVLHTGVYEGDGPETALLACPVWSALDGELDPGSRVRRVLSLHAGHLTHEIEGPSGGLRALALSSLARPGTTALRVEATAGSSARTALRPPDGRSSRRREPGGEVVAVDAGGPGVVAAASQRRSRRGALDRLAAYVGDPAAPPEPGHALAALAAAEQAGFDRLLAEHRVAWGARWETADVAVPGDDDLTLAVRFALYHLMASVTDRGEAAVGARGLTGAAYSGHVFWDTEVFVLPFLAATHAPAARALLEYRIRRLGAARNAARALGRAGVRFPWESARTGVDVTPSHARDQTGRVVAIRTGELEEHIMADIAWAAACYESWTGDEEFARGPGRELLVETARYWASRVRFDAGGRAHIFGVIGPDEYHEPVDDNAFTNVMARWNLRRAAGADGVPDDERARWLAVAEALVDGYDASTGLYEQFAGFYRLEPLLIAEVAPRRPIAADLLLGRERVDGAQVIKQADVLMLHHLVPDETAPGSLGPNIDFYEPRTAHGSSLSPAIHASLLARAGRYDDALAAFRVAARLDLDDLTGSTGGGLHLATMGGLWQALAFGFAGLRPRGPVLEISPRLPPAWPALELRVRFRGVPLAVEIRHDDISVDAPGGIAVRRAGDHWEVGT